MHVEIRGRYPSLSSRVIEAMRTNPPTDWTLEGISQYVADLRHRFYGGSTTCTDVYASTMNRARKMGLPLPPFEDMPQANDVNRRANEILRTIQQKNDET